MDLFAKKFTVTPEQTAQAVGSGDLAVLSTPSLSAMIEHTAKEYLKKDLAEGETSVGSYLELAHLKPSAVGAEIEVCLHSATKEKSKITYTFTVFENQKKIAAGQHIRAIVKTAPFLAKLAQKQDK